MTTALVFPGQASQYTGMGRELYENVPEAKHAFEEASEALGFDVAELCFNGPDDKLRQTINTQPAILATSLAALSALRASTDAEFTHTAGHSLGEYAALAAAGAIDYKTAMTVVRQRAQAMSKVHDGTMAAIMGLKKDKIEEVLKTVEDKGVAQISVFNSPSQIILSGSVEALEAAVAPLKEAGARRVDLLNVSGPFHCSLMSGAAQELKTVLGNVQFKDMHMKFYPNVTASIEADNSKLMALLIDQMTKPVRWADTVKEMVDDGVDTFIEIGPKNVLSGLIKRTVKGVRILRVEDMATLEKTIEALGAPFEMGA